MKLKSCCVCGKDLKKSKKGIGPVCEGKVGEGPNPHRAQFARTQFRNNLSAGKKAGLLVGFDFEAQTIFCSPHNYPVLPTLDQELYINKILKYFWQTIYFSISADEQHELIQRLYKENKP